jgi:hypothetical protein
MPTAVNMAFLNPRVIHNKTITKVIPKIRFPPRVFMESLISIVESLVKTIFMLSFSWAFRNNVAIFLTFLEIYINH